jgi:hypothetical protein
VKRFGLGLILFLTCVAKASVQVGLNHDKKIVSTLDRTSFLTAKMKKDLTSGFPTKVLILVRVIELPSRLVTEQIFTIESKYDLWEEKFNVASSASGKLIIAHQEELEKMLESPGPLSLLPVSDLKPGAKYRVEMLETLNPLEKEKLDSVQKWVTGQRLMARGVSSGAEAGLTNVVPETTFTSLFYSIWKRASEGDILVGELSRHDESAVFTPGELK